MQLRFKRTKTTDGYSLDMVLALTPAERQVIAAHNLADRIVYQLPLEEVRTTKLKVTNLSDNATAAGTKRFLLNATGFKAMESNISLAAVGLGKRFEHPEMLPLLRIEEQIKSNCGTIMHYIAQALTFQGVEYVYEIDGNEKPKIVTTNG
jgi:hypothetical protein